MYLRVNPVSGNVTLRQQLDYETIQQHSFKVLATDHGVPPRSSTATILLTVLDEDDELPEFQYDASSPDHYTFYVYEQLPLGTEIDKVSAIDRDSHGNDEFDYILSPHSYNDVFYIDPGKGRLYTRTSLDREAQSEYNLEVLAVTKNTPPRTSTAEVVVIVLDTNDHVPVWMFPNTNNNTVYVDSSSGLGTSVTQLVAFDADSGLNAQLKYRVVDSTEGRRFFSVEPLTGEITIRTELFNLADKMVNITLQVSDNGSPEATAEATLHIVVNKSGEVHQKSSQNLTIVISVAVVSGILAVLLIIAICWIYRQDRHDSKLRSAMNSSDQNVLINIDGVDPRTIDPRTVDPRTLPAYSQYPRGQYPPHVTRAVSHRSSNSNSKEVSFTDGSTDSSTQIMVSTITPGLYSKV